MQMLYLCEKDRKPFIYETTRKFLPIKCIGCEGKCKEFYRLLEEKRACQVSQKH